MLGLERPQLAEQRVELGVGDLGLVVLEVALVVVLDLLARASPPVLRGRGRLGAHVLGVEVIVGGVGP